MSPIAFALIVFLILLLLWVLWMAKRAEEIQKRRNNAVQMRLGEIIGLTGCDSRKQYIVLLYDNCSYGHPLVSIFERVHDSLYEHGYTRDFKFRKVELGDCTNLRLPIIAKFKFEGPNKHMALYTGTSGFGQLRDWVIGGNFYD